MDKKFVALMIVFFVVFGIFITSTLFGNTISQFARASTETDPSGKTSLIFAWPLSTTVGGKVDINVFVRNAKNLPVVKKTIKLTTTLGQINGASEFSSESDATGKANFTLTSDTAGTAMVTATVNGNIVLDQKVSIKFK